MSTYEAYALENYLAQSLIYSGNNLEHFQRVHTLFVQHGLDSSQTCSQGATWDKKQDWGLFNKLKFITLNYKICLLSFFAKPPVFPFCFYSFFFFLALCSCITADF